MTAPARRPRRSDLRAGLFAAGLVLVLAVFAGAGEAALQDAHGYPFWRQIALAVGAAWPFVPVAAAVATFQFVALGALFGYRRRAGLTLATGWLLVLWGLHSLPDILRRVADRIPAAKLPLFAPDPAAMAAFLGKIVSSALMPDRALHAAFQHPSLWLAPLLAPPLLGLVLYAAWHFLTRRLTAREGRVTRLPWLLWAALALAMAVVPLAVASWLRPDAGARPNVVLVSVDTLRHDFLGVAGDALDPSPNLDALARAGTRLTGVRAPSSWTLPSHAALLTGRNPWRLGVGRVSDAVPPHAVTLAERLAAAGYDTLAVVDHLFVDVPYGFGQGFARVRHPDTEAAPEAVDDCLAWFARHGEDRPAFLFLHLYDAHWPYRPPADVPARLLAGTTAADRAEVDKYDDAFDLVKALRAGPPSLTAAAVALYRAEIWALDRELGRLFAALEKRDRPTLVVVVSDHGEMFGAHDMYGHGITLFEGEVRVPWLLRGPGVPAGAVLDGPASLVDVAPTLLALLDLPPLPESDGGSLAGSIRASEPLPRRWLAGENESITKTPVRYLSDGVWKWRSALRERIKEFDVDYPEALNDLADDPDENVDRLGAPDTPAVAPLLAPTFGPRGKSAPAPTLDDAERARLRSLGYVQ